MNFWRVQSPPPQVLTVVPPPFAKLMIQKGQKAEGASSFEETLADIHSVSAQRQAPKSMALNLGLHPEALRISNVRPT